jgi:hypothetical protein
MKKKSISRLRQMSYGSVYYKRDANPRRGMFFKILAWHFYPWLYKKGDDFDWKTKMINITPGYELTKAVPSVTSEFSLEEQFKERRLYQVTDPDILDELEKLGLSGKEEYYNEDDDFSCNQGIN